MSFPAEGHERPHAIASVAHTCCMLALWATVSGTVLYLRMGMPNPRVGHLVLYSIIIAFEWAAFALSLWHTSPAFKGYLERVLHDPRSLVWDIPLGLILIAFLRLTAPALVWLLGKKGFVSTLGMLPSNRVEIAVWVAMALTVGVCEETVFRAYFQQQFTAWTGNVIFGIAGQAALFALCHAWQGWKKVEFVFVWGLVFGAFTWWRKGLRAMMIAHAALDLSSLLALL
jgi:membrane protease YdiL (CAAX protease family)